MKLKVQIIEALSILKPIHLDIINESDMHSGPPNRESHFKLIIASAEFLNKSRIQRQQQIYGLLDFAFKQGLHALSMKAYTPDEWAQEEQAFNSPDCMGKNK